MAKIFRLWDNSSNIIYIQTDKDENTIVRHWESHKAEIARHIYELTENILKDTTKTEARITIQSI